MPIEISPAEVARNVFKSKLFPHIKEESVAFCICLYALELGVPYMTALAGGIKIVLGNVEISPRLMNLLIRKAGHQIHILKDEEKECVLKGIRKDTGGIYECSYTMDDAQKAGNAKNNNYQKYGSDMLFARCMSRLARRLFADVIGYAYVEGEIEDASKKSQQDLDVEPEITEVITHITADQCEILDDLVVQIEDQDYLDKLKSYLKIKSFADLLPEDFSKTVKSLHQKINKTKEVSREHETESVA
jgi:hypothetical protein